MTSHAVLIASWRAAISSSAADAQAVFDDVVARYAEPHRRYHGTNHLQYVVHDVERLLVDMSLSDDDACAVRLAAFFHDAVYDSTSSTNEAHSAALATRALQPFLSHEMRDRIAQLVMATATHEIARGDQAAAVLLDADLAVFGASPGAYDAYVRGVRAEYAHVDDAAWRSGRAAVLRRFLARPRIYLTPSMQRLEATARANLRSELAALVPIAPRPDTASTDGGQ